MSDDVTLYAGRHLHLRRSGTWEYVTRAKATGVVGIVARTDADEIVLITQHRVPAGGVVVELPAGLVGDLPEDPDETVLAAAARELHEETGFVSDDWQILSDGPVSAGLTDESVHLVLARGARQTGPGLGDGTEQITTHIVPLSGFGTFLAAQRAAGARIDPKVFAAAFFLGVAWGGEAFTR